MADLATLDKAYQITMARMVQTGQAPHYPDLAAETGASGAAGKIILHDLIDTGIPAWLHPVTDYLASFPPLNDLATYSPYTV